jgi:hypothetical protein
MRARPFLRATRPVETEQSASLASRVVNLGCVGTAGAASPEGSAVSTEEEFKHR